MLKPPYYVFVMYVKCHAQHIDVWTNGLQTAKSHEHVPWKKCKNVHFLKCQLLRGIGIRMRCEPFLGLLGTFYQIRIVTLLRFLTPGRIWQSEFGACSRRGHTDRIRRGQPVTGLWREQCVLWRPCHSPMTGCDASLSPRCLLRYGTLLSAACNVMLWDCTATGDLSVTLSHGVRHR